MSTYSPALSIATAAFELGAAAWALRGPGRPEVLRPLALLLVLLAGYQVAEVFVCAAPHDVFWARVAFADVVWLPPVGWLLLLRLARPERRRWGHLTAGAFAIAGFFTVWVFADPRFVTGSVCQAVFASYTHPTLALEAYGAFYHLGLWGMIGGGIAALVHLDGPRERAHVADFLAGTVTFVVLALTTEVVYAPARDATPSIMCHYALALAIFLARVIWRERRSHGQALAAAYQH
ncbi:MAG: hypothetical protein CVU56_27360 [Deltaproteobacteria bacterium HGW-Deltaproteobacteria-14]|nr:MAG: hypothetical protein CVU56_27360 [Deltaproteobacteria bacterium HGW-Deltaproteobacteria-14]